MQILVIDRFGTTIYNIWTSKYSVKQNNIFNMSANSYTKTTFVIKR
jgi:hypothetical protein